MNYYEYYVKQLYYSYNKYVKSKPMDFKQFKLNPFYNVLYNGSESIFMFRDFEDYLLRDMIFVELYKKIYKLKYNKDFDYSIYDGAESELTGEMLNINVDEFNNYFKIVFRKKRLESINKIMFDK